MAFWNRRKDQLQRHRQELRRMCNKLLEVSGVDFDRSPQLQQALIGTFYFGMLHAHGMLHRLSPRDVRALALASYREDLHYSENAAAQAVQECINATEPTYHPTMNTIVHRGIDAHRQFIADKFGELGENIRSILERFNK